MSEKNRARQEAFTKRRQVEGLKRFQFWATPEEKDFLKKVLDASRWIIEKWISTLQIKIPVLYNWQALG